MARSSEPVVLDLAALPREQMGPFLMLGLDKSADHITAERHWADRVKWARRVPPQVKASLEDINWARQLLQEHDKRLKADAASLNIDTADTYLRGLSERYGVSGGEVTRMWQPLDSEKALADYSPPAEVPEVETVRAAITAPEVPEEVPAASLLLARLVEQPLDPWGLELPPAALAHA
jgi:hypothetical protein